MIFAIETSCDETSTSIINLEGKLLSHIIVRQAEHQKYGGVVPEIASRAHIQILQQIIPKTFKEAKTDSSSINAYCATCGPGLIGGLLVGSTIAKTMAVMNQKPFYPINHLEGHALSVQLDNSVVPPFLLLLITGGHTQLYIVNNIGSYILLGTTIDDSVGETFDKVAKMVGMPYPGGSYIEEKSKKGDGNRFKFPKPLELSGDFNFSFSGLKTAVKHEIDRTDIKDDQYIEDLCSSFQKTVIEILTKKTESAIIYSKTKIPNLKNLVIAGGVAANKKIKNSFEELCKKNNLQLISPSKNLCGDNAAMIAWACLQRYKLGYKGDLNFKPRPRWGLEELNNL